MVNVYPAALIRDAAFASARHILALGALSLLLELWLVWLVLRRYVSAPIAQFTQATDRLRQGDMSVELPGRAG